MFRRLGHRLRQLPSIAFWYDPPVVHGQIYYIDATAGNDANDGLHPLRAWQTIGQVNGETFDPEDRILFRRGETWVGIALTVPSSGVPGRPIVFGAYGVGANPIIDGNDLVNCVNGNGQDYLIFQNIEVTQGLDFGFVFDTENNITLINCDAHDCGNDNLIFDNCNQCSIQGGNFYDAYVRVNDGRLVTGIEIIDGSHDIFVADVTCYGNTGNASPHYAAGIGIHAHVANTMPYNVTVRNCTLRNGGVNCFGLRINNANAGVMTDRNIVIENNTITANAYGGIQLNSPAGVAFPLNGITIRDNTILLNTTQRQLDIINSINIEVYRNLLRNNNNSQNGQNLDIKNTKNINCFNNTLYSDFNNFWYSVVINGATCENVVVKNNIIGTAIANMMNITTIAGTGIVGMDIDYNLYQYIGAGNRWSWLGAGQNYAGWQGFNANDANSPARADPLFTNPGTDNFTLQAGSPAIDAGVDVGLPYLGTAPDCGAFERE